MSTAVLLHELPDERQSHEIAEARKIEAQRHFEAIKSANELESTNSLRIGYHAYVLKREGLFGMLGFENEEEARKKSGVGKSTWYNTIRIAEAYSGLDEEQFISMKLVNAGAALDLSEEKRKSREWVRLAGSMGTAEFQQKVDEELEGKARRSDGKEAGVTLKLSMPLSRKKVVEPGLQEYAEKIGIENGDLGRALETLIIEKKGETSLIGSITHAVQRIREAKAVRESGLSAEESMDKVMAILDDMAIEFADALKAVQGGPIQ